MMTRLSIPSAVYISGQSKYSQGAAYYNGTWVIAGSGYGNSNDLYIPTLYYTSDLYGQSNEVRLTASGSYHISGVLYNPKMYRWIAYGYKYVSNTECYPYIFHASSLSGTWFAVQLSSNPCKLTTGYYADNKLVLMGRGCGSANSGYGYAYISTTQTVSFTEVNFTTSVSAVRGLCFGDGKWAFAEQSPNIWYTDDPAGTWTKRVIAASGVYFEDMCYRDGTWCIAGWQSSGGSGRLWHSTSLTGTFKDIGITDPDDQNQAVAFANGVFVVLSGRYSSLYDILVSSNNFTTWKKVKLSSSSSSTYAVVGANGLWLACGLGDAVALRHPEADAVLPELKPEFGTTYMKAK